MPRPDIPAEAVNDIDHVAPAPAPHWWEHGCGHHGTMHHESGASRRCDGCGRYDTNWHRLDLPAGADWGDDAAA